MLYNNDPATVGLGQLGAGKRLELGAEMRGFSELEDGSCGLEALEARCKVDGVDQAMRQLHKLMVVTDVSEATGEQVTRWSKLQTGKLAAKTSHGAASASAADPGAAMVDARAKIVGLLGSQARAATADSPRELAGYKRAFELFDTDGSGRITRGGLLQARARRTNCSHGRQLFSLT